MKQEDQNSVVAAVCAIVSLLIFVGCLLGCHALKTVQPRAIAPLVSGEPLWLGIGPVERQTNGYNRITIWVTNTVAGSNYWLLYSPKPMDFLPYVPFMGQDGLTTIVRQTTNTIMRRFYRVAYTVSGSGNPDADTSPSAEEVYVPPPTNGTPCIGTNCPPMPTKIK